MNEFEKVHKELEDELRDMIKDEKLFALAASVNDLLRDLHEADNAGIFGPADDGGIALHMLDLTLAWVMTACAMIDDGKTLDEMRSIQEKNNSIATVNLILHNLVEEAEGRMN